MPLNTLFLYSFGLVASFFSNPTTQQEVFNQVNCRVGVMIVSSDNKRDYVILARETQGIRKKGTYDIFGGKKEYDETSPHLTAAREWCEEGLSLFASANTIAQASESLAQGSPLIEDVIVNTKKRSIIYQVRLSFEEITNVCKRFIKRYEELCKKNAPVCQREKDCIALVDYDELFAAAATKTRTVKAIVFDRNGKGHEKKITLRRRLLKNLAPFAAPASKIVNCSY